MCFNAPEAVLALPLRDTCQPGSSRVWQSISVGVRRPLKILRDFADKETIADFSFSEGFTKVKP